ncbi:ABC transporter ATP-binding protein [Lentibacillus sp. CBA3610]|uniref:ABC transporter ATP-binding protein n=1 Tax=Lentibacillus sp. CBA3610 TaxID=2518176 RepID=UPI00350E403A
MLSLDHVSGGYDGEPVIRDISFSVSSGEFFGILGPNGSGKTTMLKMISGLIPCTSGSIKLNNQNISFFSRKALAKKMAVLPQLTAHAFSYTVRETVALGRYAHHKGPFSELDMRTSVLHTVMGQNEYYGISASDCSGIVRRGAAAGVSGSGISPAARFAAA